MADTRKLGIIAGAGAFPAAVADSALAAGRAVHLILLKGIADRSLERYPHDWIGIGQIGRIMATGRRTGCQDIVMIGSLVRPNMFTTLPDLGALRYVPEFVRLYRGGDNHLLSGIARIFEGEGFRLVGAHEVAPELLMPHGVLAGPTLGPADRDDIDHALRAIAALGPFDVGQAVIIADRQIVAVEGAEGTDGLIDRFRAMREAGRIRWLGRKGFLVKSPKPDQDRRIDLPAVGPATVERAIGAKLRGIAVLAGSTLMIEPQAMIATANDGHLCVAGVALPGHEA